MSKITVGIVGCGPIAAMRHIPSFQKIGRKTRIVAACDVDHRMAVDTASKFGIPNSFGSLSEMLVNIHPEIVDICTPPQTHKNLAIQAMEAGCNVLVEKPIALTVAECDEMIRASKKNGVKLSAVHNQKFYPPFLNAQKLVSDGKIGKLLGMRVLNLTPKKGYLEKRDHWVHRLPSGVMTESGPHAVYMSLPFMQHVRGVRVSAKKTQPYPWASFDTYSVQLEGDSASSDLFVSHATEHFATEVDLFGTKGSVRMDLQSMLLDFQKRKSLKPLSLGTSSLSTSRGIATGVLSNAVASMTGKSFLGHDVIIKKFVECLEDESPPPILEDEARETTRVLEQISFMCDRASSDGATTDEIETVPVSRTSAATLIPNTSTEP